MAGKDYELERLRQEMDNAQREIDAAKSRLDYVSSRRDPIKSQIESINYIIADLKRSIDSEYESVRICKAARDRIGADNHRYNADSYKSSLSSQYEIKNGYRTQLDMLKSDFDSAISALREAKARKQQAREAFTRRLESLKAENEQEKAKWKETTCKKCGTTIRYHVEWTHIPELCKSCREAEKANWRETSCRVCGRTIRYNIEWTHIPSVCKECKGKR